ncbi:MAG: cytochrome P450 [Marinosulfonomonas sp.]
MIPPKPQSRPDKVSLWQYLRLFRKDILSAQPERLYRAKMAAFRTPFFQSYLINQPDLIDTVLKERPRDFPKSDRIGEGLRPLLGRSVFVTNGEEWEKQRRIIDPAFERGRLKESFACIRDAGQAACDRLGAQPGPVEIESFTSHLAADVIFRSLFSIPITHDLAAEVFEEFQTYQRNQPLLNIAAFVPLPGWVPRPHKKAVRDSARKIRTLIGKLTQDRARDIAAGTAPDDLATKIMTQKDPETGQTFTTEEMIDQVAIFFLAGHETSASALAWALYLLAASDEAQNRAVAEALTLSDDMLFSELSKLPFTRNVFKETLRLYPPVPMMVRETTKPERFRNLDQKTGAQFVISPWHLHRHTDIWDNPDEFDPDRYETGQGQASARSAYLPFSAGPRVCPGAGFAMLEGTVLMAQLLRSFTFQLTQDPPPVPVAFLTVRSRDGITLDVRPRQIGNDAKHKPE